MGCVSGSMDEGRTSRKSSIDKLKKEFKIGAKPEAEVRAWGGARETGAKWPSMFERPGKKSQSKIHQLKVFKNHLYSRARW